MGLKYNDTKISQKSTDAQYPYYNGTQVSQVYYNGIVVWKKYTPLAFTFNGGAVTGYTGTAAAMSIPSSYSTVTDVDGTTIYIAGTTTAVTSIADDAFAGNTTITSVTIPSSITSIGARAFQKCYNLATVTCNSTSLSIGYCAFALTKVSPQFIVTKGITVSSLGQGAFATTTFWHLYQDRLTYTANSDPDPSFAKKLVTSNMAGNLSDNGKTGYALISGNTIYTVSQHNGGTNTGSASGIKVTASYKSNGTAFQTLTMMDGGTINTGGTYLGGSSYDYFLVTNRPTVTWSPSVSYSSSSGLSSTAYSTSNANTSLTAGTWVTSSCTITWNTDCLIKGTLITLANGSQKAIEDLTYRDLLLVWNFQTGTYDYQYPLVLGAGKEYIYKTKITLEDNSFIEICGNHDIYDPNAHLFRKYGIGGILSTNDVEDSLYVLKHINTNTYSSVKVKEIELIKDTVISYTLITGGTITAFANNILVGSDFLNHTHITKENKFPNSFAKDQEKCYTYDRFEKEIYSNATKYLTLGLNLNYLHYYYYEGTPNYEQMFAPFINKVHIDTKGEKYLCTIGILDGDYLIESNHLEDETIILPEICTPNKTQWYVVGEYKKYNPGDIITVNFSTIIRAI